MNRDSTENVVITRKTGLIREVAVAEFNLQLPEQVRCLDCNATVCELANPSSSIFNPLKVVFSGKCDLSKGTEAGTVTIGKNKFRYRKQ